jgi:hypothetical protein
VIQLINWKTDQDAHRERFSIVSAYAMIQLVFSFYNMINPLQLAGGLGLWDPAAMTVPLYCSPSL